MLNRLMAGKCPHQLVSYPDPAFTKDKGLAHFNRNIVLPDLAGEESWDNKYIHNSGWGLEQKKTAGSGEVCSVAGTELALLQSGVKGNFSR